MPPKSTRRKNIRARRAPKRKAPNQVSKRTAVVSQIRNVNTQKLKTQVFTKTQLCESNPLALTYIGTGTHLSSIGGITVNAMPDFLNISALYNRYKIMSVTYNFNIQPVGTGGLVSFDLPKMTIRYNYNSQLTSSTVMPNVFQDLNNVKQFQFTQDKTQFAYTFYPRCNEPVYLSLTATGYKLSKPQYIDVAYPSVPHYGIMWYADSVPVGVKICLDITYKVAFKYAS